MTERTAENYVELHARSAFSFLEGASMPEAMAQQAANLELPGLAILDRGGLYGSPRLYTAAEKLGLDQGGMEQGRKVLTQLVGTFGREESLWSCSGTGSANRRPATRPRSR